MKEVYLVAYNPLWPAVYAADHFSSTSIPGTLAKPVIDRLMMVRSLQVVRT